jgi:LysM repeat protein
VVKKLMIHRIFIALLLLVVGLGLGNSSRAWQESSNLLQNPSFEGDYYAWFGISEVQVAHGWTPWWRSRTDADPPAYYFQPEYKQANGYIYPNRVHNGAAAQQWFTFFASHQAGMYQQVFNVSPGVRYRFTIWAQVWSSADDDPNVSVDPAYPNLRVGIDPTGNWDPWASTVIWSGAYAYYDSWGQLAIEAVAQNDVITVFMRSEPNFPVKHNDMYWDDAVLVAVGQGGVPIPPTSPPQNTAAPTVTSAGPAPPTATCASPPEDWVTYSVQRGDTLFGLAKRHGTTLDRVVSVNCLGTTGIYVGQVLYLPPLAATTTPSGATATNTALPSTATATVEPTDTPAATATTAPTRTPTVSSPTAAAVTATATATSAPISDVTATPTATRSRPTIPPPFTPTTGPTAAPPTSAPSGGGTRPCGTIALSAGIVLVAGVFGFRRRGKTVV